METYVAGRTAPLYIQYPAGFDSINARLDDATNLGGGLGGGDRWSREHSDSFLP